MRLPYLLYKAKCINFITGCIVWVAEYFILKEYLAQFLIGDSWFKFFLKVILASVLKYKAGFYTKFKCICITKFSLVISPLT